MPTRASESRDQKPEISYKIHSNTWIIQEQEMARERALRRSINESILEKTGRNSDMPTIHQEIQTALERIPRMS
jgi:hypothetical protein